MFLMIASIWPSFITNPHMAKSIAMGGTVNYLISFILFWLGSLPFIWFPVHKIRHLFTVKAVVAPTAGIAFLIWSLVKAGGAGEIIHQKNTAHGSTLAWAFVTGIMSAVSNFATLISNSPDFSRFSSKPSDAFLPQLFTIPMGFGLTSLVGILVGSSSAVIYPKLGAQWNPLDLLQAFITDGHMTSGVGSHGDRAGTFFIAAAFVVAQIGTNIAANSVSAGTDMTALLPRYINIRRGGYICAIIGICICPWQFLDSSSNFTTYLSAYSVFLSSITGPMVADYYFVRKGYLEPHNLYSSDKKGPYYGHHGLQWRGYVAYICGVLIDIVGFAGACGANVPIGATYIYRVDFFAGFIVSAGIYWLLCIIRPIPACSPTGTFFEVHDVIDHDTSLVVGKESEESPDRLDSEAQDGKGGFFKSKMAALSKSI